MAEPLIFDVEFNAAQSAAEAEQAIQAIDDRVNALGQSLTDAFDAASSIASTLANASVGDVEQLALFGDAAQSADQLAAGLTSAADAGQTAAQAAADVASGMEGAASAVDELAAGAADTGTQLSLFGDTQDKVSESVQKTTENQKQQTEETSKSVDLAGRLSAEFEKIQGKVGGIVGPMSRFTDEALKAVGALEGVSGVAAGGLAAGAIGLLTAGSAFKSASDTITKATGATGEALHGLQDDFTSALQGSGRSAGDLAQILGTLARDTGSTGQGLADLTDETAKFLKVTNGSVGDVRGLTQAMLALGVNAGGLAGFEDQLATVTTHFGISLSSLVQQIKTAGPALANFGFDPGQVAGLIGELDQAGLSITRLVPGFTKLAQTASGEGKTAAQALTDLIDKIKGAADGGAALNEVQGVFSGRVAAQFVNAVRNGTVDIAKLNAVMAESPGTVDRLGASVKGLSGQFGGIKNDILAAFGQAGLPLLEGLRQGIEDIRPFIRSLLDALAALTPAFKGFAEVLFLPVEALKLLGPPLQLLDTILSHIPGPILEAVGAMAAFKLLPFGAITQGLSAMAQGLVGLATSAEVAVGEQGVVGALGAGLTAINPIALAATAALAGLFGILHERSKDAAETKARIEAVHKALGDLAITATDAGPKLDAALQAGSKGGLVSDSLVAALADAGVSLRNFRVLLQQTATAPEQDVTRALRQSILDASGGIQGLTEKFGNLPTIDTGPGVQHLGQLAAEAAKTADGQQRLTDEFLNQGTVLGNLDPKLRKILDSFKDLTDAANEDARKKLATFITTEDGGAADVRAALDKLKLADATGHESEVLAAATAIAREHTAAKFGLATADEKVDQATGAVLDALEAEGALHDQAASSIGQHAATLNELAAASRGDVASNADRVRITKELVATGLSEEDAAKKVAAAEKELADIQAKHTPVTQAFNDALRNTFEQIGHGTGEWQALSGAAQTFGVDISQLEPAFDNLNQQLQKFAPPIKVGDDVMGQLIIDMQRGLPIQATFNDLMAVSGGNTAEAMAALTEYTKGVDDTKKALDGLNPSLGTTVSKLEDAAKIDFAAGPDAAGQLAAISDTAKARRDGFQGEIDDLNAAKQARSDADQASIDAQKAALEDQKKLAQDAAKARGEAFDSTGIDLQIKALKARTDTGDLDAQIKDLETRQKDVDAQLARAQAALGVFDDEERAIRARSTLQDSDLAHQQDVLAASRLVAEQQAAAAGIAFDPTAINNQINNLQAQRDKLTAGTDQAVADAQAASQRVQGAVEDAQGGVLNFGAVLDTFDAKLRTEALQAQTVTDLKGQGFTSLLQVLFDPQAGLSGADQAAFLEAIATASPEERAALDAHAKESLKLISEKDSAINKAGDAFANPNATAVDNANKRGAELAKGLAEGFVQTLDDSKINEIIDLVIKTGVDPVAARKAVLDKVNAAKAAAQGPAAPTLAGVGISADQVLGAEDALGVAGTTGGSLLLQGVQDAIKAGIDPDAAAAMVAPVVDQLPRIGTDGGTTVAHEVGQAIKDSPIDPDAASVLAENLRTQLPVEGTASGGAAAAAVGEAIKNSPIDADAAAVLLANLQAQMPAEGAAGGAGYATSVPGGMVANPIPPEQAAPTAAGITGNVTTAMGAEGVAAANAYIAGIGHGLNDPDVDAVDGAQAVARRIKAATEKELGIQSPSKVGISIGRRYVEGISLGMSGSIGMVSEVASKIGQAVSAPIPTPALVGAGVGAAAAAASGAGAFSSNGTATSVHIENVNVTGTTNATGDDVATALSRKIGWLGITGRAEL